MSHIGSYGTTLGQVDQNLLMEAFKMVARSYAGGEVKTSIEDYYGSEVSSWEGQRILAAISTDKVKRGMGAIINNGELKFVGDSYGCSDAFRELKREIEHAYIKLGVLAALQALGYETSAQATFDGVILSGVKK